MRNTKFALTGVAVGGLMLTAAACTPHHKAEVQAVSTNPAVVKAEAAAKVKVSQCATQVGLFHLALHPVTGFRAVEACAVPASERVKVKACAQKVVDSNGVSKAAVTADEDGLAQCIAEGAS